MTLIEHDGVTTLQTLVQHKTRENRDGHVNSGMEVGMQGTFDRLDTLLDIADTPSERFRRIAGGFTDRVEQVPVGAWSNLAPCEGWTARDVVGHLVGWVPYVIGKAGIEFAPVSVDTDPASAWASLVTTLQTCLDDPNVACREFDAGPPGRLTVERAIDMLVTGDVLIHTWDLARAAGLDERLDAVFVHTTFEGMQQFDDILRASGHYGPKVAIPERADEQARLLAFTGRNPS